MRAGRFLTCLWCAGAACASGSFAASAHAQSTFVDPIARTELVSEERPPEPRITSRPPIPFPHAVWVEGFWDREHGQWTWREGHWVSPRRGMHWRDARWQPLGDGWVRVPGQWR